MSLREAKLTTLDCGERDEKLGRRDKKHKARVDSKFGRHREKQERSLTRPVSTRAPAIEKGKERAGLCSNRPFIVCNGLPVCIHVSF